MAARRIRKAGTVYATVPKRDSNGVCMICGTYIKDHVTPCWKTTTSTKKGSSSDTR